MDRWAIDEPLDPDAPPPKLCPLHGTILDGEFCQDCYLTLYESSWAWADELDDRDERDREEGKR